MTTIDPLRGIRISAHAVHRWIERVDPCASPAEARLALGRFLLDGRFRSTPRHWTDVEAAPGLRFVYCCTRSEVCALVVDGVVVTVVTRSLCRTGARRTAGALRAAGIPPHPRGRRLPAAEVTPWRRNERLDAA